MNNYLKTILFLLVLFSSVMVFQEKASAAMCGLLVPTDSGKSCLYGQHYGNSTLYQSLNKDGYMDFCNTNYSKRQDRIYCLKRRFIAKIKNYRINGQTHQRVGAQYIMTSIIGRDTSKTTKDLADMEAAINNAKTEITIDYSYTFKKNTGYLPINTNFDSTGSVRIYNDNQTVPALVIKNSGKLVAAIKLNCGNMVYGSEVPSTIDWTLSGSSSYDGDGIVKPGDDVTFRHKILNNGPDAALYRYKIMYAHLKNGEANDIAKYSNPFSGDTWVADGVSKGSYRPNGVGTPGVDGTHVLSNIGNVVDGDKLCELIQFTDATGPDSDPDNYNGKSQSACVTVKAPAKFTLIPSGSIELDDDESPTTATYKYCVALQDNNVSIVNANISVRIWKNTTLLQTNPSNDPITVNDPSTCVSNKTYSLVGQTLKVDDQICVQTFVTPTSESNSATATSAKDCKKIVNKPVFWAYNGSVSVGQCSSTSGGYLGGWFNNVVAQPLFRGSATNLATVASNVTVGFASARGNAGAYGSNVLTFAKDTTNNRDNDSPSFGLPFGNVPCLKDAVKDSNASAITGTPLNWSSITNDDKQYSYTGKLSIPANNSYSGKATIYVDGDVYISGNIVYANSNAWSNASDIPRLIIRAKGNIYISSTVNRLDGVYIAKPTSSTAGGAIYTCADTAANNGVGYSDSQLWDSCGGSAPLTPANSLTVYGVFIANKINLLRTAGSLRSAGTIDGAAEKFYLSPEIYLNGTNLYTNSSSSGVLPYDAIYNLPPVL